MKNKRIITVNNNKKERKKKRKKNDIISTAKSLKDLNHNLNPLHSTESAGEVKAILVFALLPPSLEAWACGTPGTQHETLDLNVRHGSHGPGNEPMDPPVRPPCGT